jgi:riboflavin synthase alpha subunit
MGAKPGDKVNLECDMIGKYIARAMDLDGDGKSRKGL